MTKVFTALLVMFLVFFSSLSTAHAVDVTTQRYTLDDLEIIMVDPPPHRTPGEFGEKQTWLQLRQRAPFSGILVNEEGMAYVLTEYHALEQRANLALERQRASDLALLNREVLRLEIELDATKKKGKIELWACEGKRRELEQIHDEKLRTRDGLARKFLIGTGGVVVGVLIGVLVGGLAL